MQLYNIGLFLVGLLIGFFLSQFSVWMTLKHHDHSKNEPDDHVRKIRKILRSPFGPGGEVLEAPDPGKIELQKDYE